MAVQAMFWVTRVTKVVVSGGLLMREVELTAKTRHESTDNVDWSKYTPSGSIKMMVTQDAAGEWFEELLANDVAVTFTKAVAP